MLKSLIKGRFLGHPVHPMLIHFPTAFFPLSLIFDLLGMINDDPALFKASFYSMVLGLAIGCLAVVFGTIDYLKLARSPALFGKASWHGGIQFCVLAIFGVLAGIRFQTYPDLAEPGYIQLVVMAVAISAMLAANYLGGDLVFRDGVGVRGQ